MDRDDALQPQSDERDTIDLIRQIDAKFRGDESLRRAELKRVQRDFYKASLIELLRQDLAPAVSCETDLQRHAEQIITKRGFLPTGDSEHRRTRREHQLHTTVRKQWFKLMKEAGAKRIDSRGG